MRRSGGAQRKGGVFRTDSVNKGKVAELFRSSRFFPPPNRLKRALIGSNFDLNTKFNPSPSPVFAVWLLDIRILRHCFVFEYPYHPYTPTTNPHLTTF